GTSSIYLFRISDACWRERGGAGLVPAPVMTPGGQVREPGQDTRGHHGGDQQHSDDDVDDVDRGPLQAQRAREDPDQQNAGDDARQLAATAEDGDSAEE